MEFTMRKIIFALPVIVAPTGCTAINVQSLSNLNTPEKICIRNNPQGDSTHTFTYSALRSWDIATYLSQAELRILKDDKQIAFAEYRLRGKG